MLVWIMKSSMAMIIEVPTATILRYQPANYSTYYDSLSPSPSEPPEVAVAGANGGEAAVAVSREIGWGRWREQTIRNPGR